MARRSQAVDTHKRKIDRKIHQNYKAREAIQSGAIVKRLQDYLLDDGKDEEHTAKVYMTPAKINVASILLRKIMPDLSTVEIDMSGDGLDRNKELEQARIFAEGPSLPDLKVIEGSVTSG